MHAVRNHPIMPLRCLVVAMPDKNVIVSGMVAKNVWANSFGEAPGRSVINKEKEHAAFLIVESWPAPSSETRRGKRKPAIFGILGDRLLPGRTTRLVPRTFSHGWRALSGVEG